MTTAATSLLGLALPVTGELAGSWGDTVNNSITSLLDSAVAGTTTLSTDGDVTLTTTTLAANQARQAILLCSGARTALRTITAPAQSKIYTIINATTGGFSVKLVGVGPTTGVTIVAGESAVCAWNGSDFIKVSNTGGSASFTNVTVSGTTTLSGLTASTALALNSSKEVVSVTNTGTGNNVLSASPTLTGTVGGASLTLSSLTSGRVTYAGTSGLLQDSANLTFDGTSLTLGGNPTLSGGTANGVAYLNGSKVLTTGSALTFDGTTLTGTASGALAANFNRTTSSGPTVKVQVVGNDVGTLGSSTDGQGCFDVAATTSLYLRATGTSGNFIRFDANNSEQMRLTSTGLGIGTSSPGARLTTRAAANSYTAGAFQIESLSGTYKSYITNVGGLLLLSNSSTVDQLTLDTSGNLGLGVTPRTWSSGAASIDIGVYSSDYFRNAGFIGKASNAYYNSGWLYTSTNRATRYEMSVGDGSHAWFNAPSGTAGNAITFTQAMTLDASGSLAVGGTTVVTNNGGITATTTSSGSIATTLAMRNAGTANGSGSQLAFRGVTNAGSENDYGYLTMVANDTTAKSSYMGFWTSNSGTLGERARIDSSGNLGLGVTPSASSACVNMELSSYGATLSARNTSSAPQFAFMSNAVGNWYAPTYKINGKAAMYLAQGNDGSHSWYTAASGNAGDPVTFTQAMTLDSSGNLGIGTSSPAFKLDVDSTAGTVANLNSSNANGPGLRFTRSGTANGYVGSAKYIVGGALADFGIDVSGANNLIFGTNDVERARIDSSGNFLVGNNPTNIRSSKFVVGGAFSTGTAAEINNTDNSSWIPLAFHTSGNLYGYISSSSAGTNYNTVSDYRLKTVVGPVAGAGQRIDALQPVEYTWNSNGSRTRGFLAHQFQEVYASSVTGTKDAVDAEGRPVYQAMQASTSEVIADLIAEIQSLRKRLAAAGI